MATFKHPITGSDCLHWCIFISHVYSGSHSPELWKPFPRIPAGVAEEIRLWNLTRLLQLIFTHLSVRTVARDISRLLLNIKFCNDPQILSYHSDSSGVFAYVINNVVWGKYRYSSFAKWPADGDENESSIRKANTFTENTTFVFSELFTSYS